MHRFLACEVESECEAVVLPAELQSRMAEIKAEMDRQATQMLQLDTLKRELRDKGVTLRERDEEIVALSLQVQMLQSGHASGKPAPNQS